MLEDRSTHDGEIILQGLFDAAPEQLFHYWIQPDLLTQWWPQHAETEPRPGGSYCLSWPAYDWYLRGTYQDVQPGERLAFSWHWDHLPDVPERKVEITFQQAPEGTLLTIRHGEYGPQDAEERAGHITGWTAFADRLYTLIGA